MSNLPLAKNPMKKEDIKTPDVDMSYYRNKRYGSRFCCCSFLKEFYNREYGIDFGDWESDLSPKDKNAARERLLSFANQLWYKVGYPEVGDIVILDSDPIHLLINIGDGFYAHSVYPLPVTIRKIGDINKHNIIGIYRYKGK